MASYARSPSQGGGPCHSDQYSKSHHCGDCRDVPARVPPLPVKGIGVPEPRYNFLDLIVRDCDLLIQVNIGKLKRILSDLSDRAVVFVVAG